MSETNENKEPEAVGSDSNEGLDAALAPWRNSVMEFVAAFEDMEKGIRYNPVRLHNAIETLKALVLPGYGAQYRADEDEPDPSDDPELNAAWERDPEGV